MRRSSSALQAWITSQGIGTALIEPGKPCVAGSIRSARVIEVLARPVSERGAPHYLRSDNRPEFDVARQNGVAESFNGKVRDDAKFR